MLHPGWVKTRCILTTFSQLGMAYSLPWRDKGGVRIHRPGIPNPSGHEDT